MDAAAELGRNVVSTHQIQPEYGDEQADAGRDCRTRLARPNFSGTNADRNIFIFSVQLTTCRTGNLTQLIHTLAICVTHTYIRHLVPYNTLQYTILAVAMLMLLCPRRRHPPYIRVLVLVHVHTFIAAGDGRLFFLPRR